MGIRGIARQVGGSKQSGAGGNWLNPGKGVLIVSAMKDGTKPEFYKGETALCEFIVESCTGFTGILDEKNNPKPAGNQVGSTCTYVEGFRGEWEDLARGRFKDFLMKLFDETEESLTAGAALVAKTVAEGGTLPGALGEFVCKLAKEEIAKGATWNADMQFTAIYEFCMADRGANRARGMRIAYSTVEKKTGEGKMISVPKWETIKQTDAEIAECRAALSRVIPKAS